MIQGGVARAFEQQRGILLVCAVDNHRVKSFGGEFLYGDERFQRQLNGELQFTQYLRDQACGGLIRAEK